MFIENHDTIIILVHLNVLRGSSGAMGVGNLDLLQTRGYHGAKDRETAYVIRDVIDLRSY